jgi:ribonuclease Z
MIIKAYSKGLYSNWYFYAPDRVLFDCGEGAALNLRAGIFAIEKIFLSHGHIDHIAGLPLLVSLRQSTKGANSKPLDIYYPGRDRRIAVLRNMVDQMMGDFIKFPLRWHPIDAGDKIELKKGRHCEAIKVIHPADQPLGFRVLEQRKRLNPEHAGKSGRELAVIPADDKFDYYDAKMFCYSGDSMPIDPVMYEDAEILIHDCTFLKASDREGPTHCTLQEVFDLAHAARAKRLILAHISPRYEPRRVVGPLIEQADSHGLDYHWIPHHKVVEF